MTDLQARAEAAADAVERMSRELDITNADHIALWLEANMADSTLGWLACRIIEAHEQALALHALQSEGWRPISEADQAVGNEVLGFAVYHGKPVRFVVEWNGHNWYAGWGDAIQPTRFRALPAPPEGEGA